MPCHAIHYPSNPQRRARRTHARVSLVDKGSIAGARFLPRVVRYSLFRPPEGHKSEVEDDLYRVLQLAIRGP